MVGCIADTESFERIEYLPVITAQSGCNSRRKIGGIAVNMPYQKQHQRSSPN